MYERDEATWTTKHASNRHTPRHHAHIAYTELVPHGWNHILHTLIHTYTYIVLNRSNGFYIILIYFKVCHCTTMKFYFIVYNMLLYYIIRRKQYCISWFIYRKHNIRNTTTSMILLKYCPALHAISPSNQLDDKKSTKAQITFDYHHD